MEYQNLCLGCMEDRGSDIICPHCGWVEGTAPESALHLPPGTVLQEKYLIGKALGQGGFGITYLAWDMNLNLKLAIKEYLPQELAYRTGGHNKVSVYKKTLADNFNYGLEKFLEEARTLARFNEHPNIVSVRDFFKANGTAYLVMNHIEGVTLKEHLISRDKPLAFEQAVDIFMPVLDALKEVHAAGILHRDISPDNLLISNRGRVVLIDFGSARQAMGNKSRSMSVIMKAGYSPEEQYRSRGEQGPWTDIYAVAATMYHAITGVMPPESLDRLKEDPLDLPSTIGVKIETHQEDALLKAMAVQAEDRYQTVEEFQKALTVDYNRSNRQEPYTRYNMSPSYEVYMPTGPQVRPWVRFFARLTDIHLFSLIFGLILGLAYPLAIEMHNILFGIIVLVVFVFIEPLFLSTWGATPGKALLNVRLRKSDGRKPNYKEALLRSFNVWLRGEGLGIPIVILATRIYAYTQLKGEGITTWDRDGGFSVSHQIISAWRIILIIAFHIGYFFILAMEDYLTHH